MSLTRILLLISTLLEPGAGGPGLQAPLLTCAEPVYYVGTTRAESRFRVEHTFWVVNQAATPTRIVSVEPDCGCSSKGRRAYDIRFDRSLPGGSRGRVSIGFSTAPVAEVPDIRQFTVRVAGAGRSELGLTVLAKRLGGLDLFPGTDVLLRRGRVGKAATTLYLVSDDSPDLRVAVGEPLEKGVSVVLERIMESSKIHLPAAVWDSGSVFAIRIEIDGPPRSTSKKVVLKTDHGGGSELSLNLSIF